MRWIAFCLLLLIESNALGIDELSEEKRKLQLAFQKLSATTIPLVAKEVTGQISPHDCLLHYEAAGKDRRKMAFVIGTHLSVVNRLVKGTDRDKQDGLGIAFYAVQQTLSSLKDPELARDVASTYILPYLDSAKRDTTVLFNKEMLLKQIVSVAVQAKDMELLLGTATTLRDEASTRNVADFARLRIAQAQYQLGNIEAAILTLEEIDSSDQGMGGAKRYIEELKKKASNKSK